MNRIYRVVFNIKTNTYQAVPETSTGKHKSVSEKSECTPSQKLRKGAFFLKAGVIATINLISGLALAAPVGGQVSAGQASIQQNGKTTSIHQTSQKAAINWQKFGIKADEVVNFKQPNAQSVTLNRVIGNEKSVIDGALKANGKVFITNPNGVMIGNGAKINVGALLATTGKISDKDFMAGNYVFKDAKGQVENNGAITVPEGGAVALLAPVVRNQGTITTPQGNALLASAEQFSLTLQDDNFAYTLDKGALQGLVDNGGAIYADAGRIVLTAKGVDRVKKSLIQHSGIAEANTVRNQNGVIELLGDLDNTRLAVSGSLKAEAKENGNGGFVETSAAELAIAPQADISTQAKNGKTGTWLIDPKDLTVAPSGGDMTGAQVSRDLGKNNVTLQSRKGKGDVIINDEISWNKNTLTLNAKNDIHINKTLNGTGSASLKLEYGQGTNDGGESNYYLDKETPLSARTVKVNLPAGQNLSIKKGKSGETQQFDVIHQMPEIVKDKNNNYVSQFKSNNIALGADIDVSYTRNYEGFAGWQLPNNQANIHGLGHNIDRLSMKSSQDNTGLFSKIYSGSIRDLNLTNLNIKSSANYTGGLVGRVNNKMTVHNITASGSVKGIDYTGSIIGRGNSTNLKNVKFVGNITGDTYVGGLAGEVNNLDNVVVIGNVQASGNNVGGLAGITQGDIHDSSAGMNIVQDTNNIINVSGKDNVGGLVGLTYDGSIYRSFVAGNVNGQNKVAGLMGSDADDGIRSTISESYFAGNVTATGKNIGGLGGYDVDYINNSYVLGNITGVDNVGGLVGNGLGFMNVRNSYFNGMVSGIGKNVSNLFGVESYSNYIYNKNYFNTDKTRPFGKYGYGKSSSEMMKKSTYESWDFDKVWRIAEGVDYPRLRALTEDTVKITPTLPKAETPKTETPADKTDVGVNAHDLKKTYDGVAVRTEDDLRGIAKNNGYDDIVSVSGLKDGDTLANLGKLTYGGTWKNAKNAGKYSIVPSGLNGGQKYEIKYGEGSLTIGKRPIAISGSRQYDGTDDAYQGELMSALPNVKEKLVKSDADKVKLLDVFTLQGKGTLAQKDAAEKVKITDKGNLTLGGITQNAKEIIKNYEIDTAKSDWQIKPKDLTITAMNNIKPEGENNPDVSSIGVIVDGLVKGEKISDVKLSYSDNKKSQGDISIIRVGEPVFAKGKASNYAITKKDGKLLTVQKYYELNDKFDPKNHQQVVEIRDKLNKVEDEMLLAQAVYGGGVDIPVGDMDRFYDVYEIFDPKTGLISKHGLSEKSKDPNKVYRKLYEVVRNDTNLGTGIIDIQENGNYGKGLSGALYRKTGTSDYYIVFRGSDDNMAKLEADWKTNLAQVVSVPAQYEKAYNFSKSIMDKINSNGKGSVISIIGHSLGGGLTMYAAGMLGNTDSVTFNASPLWKTSTTLEDIFDKNRYGSHKVGNMENYVFDNDILDTVTPDVAVEYFGKGKTKIDFLPFRNNGTEDHGMSHVIKTQRLANIITENNEAVQKCGNTDGCNVLRDTRWMQSLSRYDTAVTNRNLSPLSSWKSKIDQEVAKLENQGKNIDEINRLKDQSYWLNDVLVDGLQKAFVSEKVVIITATGNSVTLNPRDTWQFSNGDIISTLDKSAYILFHDGSWVTLDKNTTIKIDFSTKQDDDTSMADQIIWVKGRIIAKR